MHRATSDTIYGHTATIDCDGWYTCDCGSKAEWMTERLWMEHVFDAWLTVPENRATWDAAINKALQSIAAS
jgi:hypothetical protein